MMDTDLRIEKKKRVPSLRFAGFDGEWEVKRLGSVADIIMGQSPAGNSYNTAGVGTALINGPVEFTEKYPIKTKWTSRPTKLCQNKDILFCVRGSTTGKMNIADGIYCIGRGVAAIRANKKSTSEFIEFLIVKNLTQILALTSGSTFFNLDSKSLKEYIISFPTLPEQQKIASFLTAVDEKLQALKQQKNLLEQYKKGMMQRIFSQEIRFKDDNRKAFGEWEMKKLGEVFHSKKGKGLSKDNLTENGTNECILYGELYTKYSEVISTVISKTNTLDGLKSKNGDLLIPCSTTTTGIDLANVTAVNKEGILLGGDITVLRSNKKINNIFYAYYLSNHKKKEIAHYAQGSTIIHLYFSHIKDMTIALPTLPEQTKIAHFLSAIDEKISHCQVHITKMEQYKKGLLQQLFV